MFSMSKVSKAFTSVSRFQRDQKITQTIERDFCHLSVMSSHLSLGISTSFRYLFTEEGETNCILLYLL